MQVFFKCLWSILGLSWVLGISQANFVTNCFKYFLSNVSLIACISLNYSGVKLGISQANFVTNCFKYFLSNVSVLTILGLSWVLAKQTMLQTVLSISSQMYQS
uniref:Uncharacterized protein n=1 Tax=Cacopsylla melanoneura TaxID=428564 RepID=A0A8D9BA61_9HEMI